MEIQPDVMQPEEAAARLGISLWTFRDLCRRGEIPHIRLGRRIVVPRVMFDRFLAGEAA